MTVTLPKDRAAHRAKGAEIARRLRLDGEPEHWPPGFAGFVADSGLAGIWARPGLSLADRMIVALSSLALRPKGESFRAHVEAALDLGLDAAAIRETFVQVGLYAGLPVADEALALAHEVFVAKGTPLPADDGSGPDSRTLDELEADGRAVMAKLHGDRSTRGYAAPGGLSEPLYDIAIVFAYGALWNRPGLDHRQRVFPALAAFTGLHNDTTLAKFALSALNVGVSEAEVIEAIMQTAPYTGFPTALSAIALIETAFRDR